MFFSETTKKNPSARDMRGKKKRQRLRRSKKKKPREKGIMR